MLIMFLILFSILVVNLEAAFDLSPEEFQQTYNRAKPGLDDPIIFVCKKGIRAKIAYDQITAKGYTK